ncbi:glutathione-disulfide reductase GRX8 NDAI_0J02010 [Naumovozyma dairenensis CBS 421]|uniref:Glutaredoxin domain-containing protein n=1 Tax=Naumovozyma dairenensis (strain ATCC 10597 / BCRC 20456 / CBS 421 / NBRC 0211 / NRRL Y-12639) TaxID=1071378 RepID=G0WH15_NAUDC|nr:hypothetical protein NDAI_0J02010 [Naumovozyma dairenensis CBS 421]CCD27093.1 hypothetical protein NDAI_0J02010 [Naumovozyma dairenensis CBS 421]
MAAQEYITKAKELIDSNKYFQFSANWCKDCVYTLSVWDKYNIRSKFKIFDIGDLSKEEQTEWRNAFEEVTGIRNLPTIIVDGEVWGTETKLHELEDMNQLEFELKRLGLVQHS